MKKRLVIKEGKRGNGEGFLTIHLDGQLIGNFHGYGFRFLEKYLTGDYLRFILIDTEYILLDILIQQLREEGYFDAGETC